MEDRDFVTMMGGELIIDQAILQGRIRFNGNVDLFQTLADMFAAAGSAA
ncbi:MAG: SCP2 sterol-binding domain-containing protein [Myxococcota bacterium]